MADTHEEWSKRSLTVQYTISRAMMEGIEDAMPGILQAIGEGFGWELGTLWLVDAGTQRLRCASLWHATAVQATAFEELTRGMALARGEGLPGRVWESRESAWIPDVLKDANFPRLHAAAAAGLHGAFAFPISGSGGCLGAMEFIDRAVRPPDEDLLRMVDSVGSQIGLYIERKRAEAEGRESHALKSAILEAALDAIIVMDRDGRVVEFNPAAERIFGRLRAEVVGREMAGLIIPPSLRDQHRAGLARYLETGEGPLIGRRFEAQALRSDGAEFPVEVSITRIPSAASPTFAGFVRDVSVRRQFEEAFQESEERFRLLVDGVRDYAIFMMDVEGRITSWNPGAERTTGYRAEEMIGQPFHTFFTTEDLRARVPVHELENAAAYGRADDERWHVRKDGTRFYASGVTTSLRDETGHLRGFAKIMRDVTDRKQMEEELQRRAEQLADEAQRKDQFLALLAHELRNPLAPILSAVHLMRMVGGEDPSLGRARDVIERQVRHMARLIDDLLDLSRIQRGKITLAPKRTPLAPIIQHAVEGVRSLADVREQQLTVSLPEEALWLNADVDRLQQVLVNLLNNAIKFTEPRGRIAVTAEREGREIVIVVADTGRGIAPDLLPRVFDLFTQADSSLDRSQGGLGIGLTLVRNLVAMHGGRVEAHSAGIGQGSEFMVRLPAADAGGPPPAAGTRSGDESLPAGTPLRILVIEDNEDARSMLTNLLEAWGHQVEVAANGPLGLERLLTFRPDVALVDIGLPDLNGYELAGRIRSAPGGESILLIAITGYGQPADRSRALEAGFDAHLTKPVDPEALRHLLAGIGG